MYQLHFDLVIFPAGVHGGAEGPLSPFLVPWHLGPLLPPPGSRLLLSLASQEGSRVPLLILPTLVQRWENHRDGERRDRSWGWPGIEGTSLHQRHA